MNDLVSRQAKPHEGMPAFDEEGEPLSEREILQKLQHAELR